MKHTANNVDVRIKNFMKKKLGEFPDLAESRKVDVRVVQRGYLLEDMVSFFTRKG